jgi:hypothetical protein
VITTFPSLIKYALSKAKQGNDDKEQSLFESLPGGVKSTNSIKYL